MTHLLGAYYRIVSWFTDNVFRRLFMNAGKLLSANGISAILGFTGTVLTARALGVENYGFLALVLAYVQVIGQLATFSIWQAFIKYGSERLKTNDRDGLRQLIKFGFSLDVGTAIVATCLAIMLSNLVSDWLGWSQTMRPYLRIYSLLILFSLNGTPAGILRLFDRFDLLSYSAALTGLIRFAGIVVCYGLGWGLNGFILAYLITGVLGQLISLLGAFWVLHRQQLANFVGQSLSGFHDKFPGIWHYVWTSNVNQTIRMLSREMDELVVAGFTSPSDLGLYKIAKQFSKILPMLAEPLYQSIYPELAKLWSLGDKARFVSLIKRSTLLVAVPAFTGWITFVLFGKWLILVTVGPLYIDVYWIAVSCMLAVVIAICTFSLTPALLAMGSPGYLTRSLILSTIVYFVVLVVLLNTVGIIGAALSYIVFYVVWTALMLYFLFRANLQVSFSAP